MNIELSLGNLVMIGAGALLFIPSLLLGCKYIIDWKIPVVSNICSGIQTIWKVAQ